MEQVHCLDLVLQLLLSMSFRRQFLWQYALNMRERISVFTNLEKSGNFT